ncbi:MAG: hypothetical protein II309_00185 [Bacilli bacterium]|jgi:hypothetical protein|nr:hypothetical protein [Bacilli bacterium]
MAKIDFNNIDEKTKGYIKIGIIILGLLVGFLIILLVAKLFIGSVVPFDKIENIMVRAADQYMTKHEDKFNKSEPYETIELNVSDLVVEGYMKDFSKYTEKNVMCNGKVLVIRNDENVSYIPKLDCGDAYKYKELVETIIAPENIVTADSGLYKIETDTPYYMFRGEYPDNYVSYAGSTWRIMKINEQGNIQLISDDHKVNSPWDNRYNVDKKGIDGINEFEGTQACRLKDNIIGLYNDEEYITKENKSLLIPQQLCIEKRSSKEFDNTGNKECSKKSELMGLGSIYLSEFIQSSLDSNCLNAGSWACANYNYLTKYKYAFWTITANSDNSYQAYFVDNFAKVGTTSRGAYIRLTAVINGKINYKSGTGTETDPYIIEPITVK